MLRPLISTMPLFKVLSRIEERFDRENAWKWMSEYWFWSIIISMAYVGLILVGNRIMKNRSPFDLRRGTLYYLSHRVLVRALYSYSIALTMWNTGLAVFSILGSITTVSELFYILIHEGFSVSVCKVRALYYPPLSIWAWLFIISKFIELGDTIFIVLRQTPLTFLHWYHHVTVFIYTWFANSYSTPSGIGLWFASMNYSVHSIMYGYYAIKASGRRVPKWISQLITVLQLSQMFVAIICNYIAYTSYYSGKECDFLIEVFYIGMIIYGTYAVLFMNFFYQRYVLSSRD